MEVLPSFRAYLTATADEIAAVLFDIDGTLIAGGHALPGAAAALADLRQRQLPYLLLTNDGSSSTRQKAAALGRAGIAVDAAEIVSCSDAIAGYVEAHGLAGATAFVTGQLGDPCYAELAGLRATRDPDALPECRVIVIGEGCYDWQPALNHVLNALIANPRLPLLVPNPDSYWPAHGGRINLGSGAKARLLQTVLAEYGIQLSPVFLGKPNAGIFEQAMNRLSRRGGQSLAAGSILMIGDSLRSDVAGANRAGMLSGLVLSGITEARHLAALTGDCEMWPRRIFAAL